MEEKQLREWKAIYLMGTLHAALHLAVGIVWETVGMPQGEGPLLSLPYFGGELALVAISLLLVFLYLGLSLRRQPRVPVHLRRFCLTLSIIVTLGSIVLMVVMCIRTNDYRKEQNNLAREAYYGAVLLTIVDIIATIFFLPSYLYLACGNYLLVKQEEKRIQRQKSTNQPIDDPPEEQIQTPTVPDDVHSQQAANPQTERNLQPATTFQTNLQNLLPQESPISQQHLTEEGPASPPVQLQLY